MPHQNHEKFMQRALELAAKGRTSPNPKVGCVLVKNNRILAEGYHKKAGMPHAEIEALRHAKNTAKNATMYVTLEPCCHENKRTPPCVNAIVAAGIKKVIVACKDPNPAVNGKGIRLLKKEGIDVEVGVLKDEALAINESYVHWITTQKPFVILKLATTLDGKIATKNRESKWITNELSRKYVHQLRNKVDAILVGINTVLHDNPQLTCRIKGGHDPLRIILDSNLKIPLNAKVLKDKNALIATTHHGETEKIYHLKERGIRVMQFQSIHVPLPALLEELGKCGITSLMIEGGASVAGEALKERVVQKVVWFIAPKIFGGDAKSAVAGEGFSMKKCVALKNVRIQHFGTDVCVEGYV